MNRRSELVLFLLCLIAGFAGAAGAEEKGRLQKIWKVRITDLIGRAKGQNPADILVFGLGFSPDGERIAAVVGPSRKDQIVLVLNIKEPKNSVHKIVVNPEFYEAEWPGQTRSILWSNTGQDLILNRALIHLSDGSSCTLSKSPIKLSSVALYQTSTAKLKYFDWKCDPIEVNDSSNYLILDASQERGRLAISFRSPMASPVDIVETDSLKPVMQIPGRREPFSNLARFAESGKVVCTTSGTFWRQNAFCWDVDAGKLISMSQEHTCLFGKAA
jgi:hypothetical protein